MSVRELALERLRELRGRRGPEELERRVLEELAGGRVLTAAELEVATGLGRGELLDALGRLYDQGELRTDSTGAWWRPVSLCPTCRHRRGRGERVIFCCRCIFHRRNE